MSKKPHNSPLSNTLPGALVEALGGLLIEYGRWALAFVMGVAALMWLVVAGLRDE